MASENHPWFRTKWFFPGATHRCPVSTSVVIARLAENRKRERQTQRGSDVLYRREFPRHALQRKGGLFEKHTDRVTQALNDGEYKLSTATGQAGCAPNGF